MSFERSYSLESHERIKQILIFGNKSLLLPWWVIFVFSLDIMTNSQLKRRLLSATAVFWLTLIFLFKLASVFMWSAFFNTTLVKASSSTLATINAPISQLTNSVLHATKPKAMHRSLLSLVLNGSCQCFPNCVPRTPGGP